MDTLLLDVGTWDLVADASGNIGVAKGPLAIAQDVASAARLFKGELWYDTSQGMPYFEAVLDKRPSVGFLRAKFREQGLLVPGTIDVDAQLDPLTPTRVLSGKLVITDNRGTIVSVFGGIVGVPELPWYVQAISYGSVQSLGTGLDNFVPPVIIPPVPPTPPTPPTPPVPEQSDPVPIIF